MCRNCSSTAQPDHCPVAAPAHVTYETRVPVCGKRNVLLWGTTSRRCTIDIVPWHVMQRNRLALGYRRHCQAGYSTACRCPRPRGDSRVCARQVPKCARARSPLGMAPRGSEANHLDTLWPVSVFTVRLYRNKKARWCLSRGGHCTQRWGGGH